MHAIDSRFIATFAAASLVLPAAACAEDAAATTASPSPSVARFSLQVDLGFFTGIQIGYRLPALDDRLDLFVRAVPLVIANYQTTTAQPRAALLGARYYPWTQGWLRPYGVASVGAEFGIPEAQFGLPQSAVNGFFGPFVSVVGLGVEFMPIEHLGLTASLNAYGSTVPMPEVGLKAAL